MFVIAGRGRFHLTSALLLSGLILASAGASIADDASSAGLQGPSVRMIDLDGNIRLIGESDGTRATALVFLTTECPICRQYIPELNRIAREAKENQAEFYGVFVDRSVNRRQIQEFVTEFAVEFPVFVDASGDLADRLQPNHVPEAFVLNAHRSLVYRGRIDDVYAAVGRRRLEPTERNLVDAIMATVAGETVSSPATEPIGCLFEFPSQEARLAEVTFHRDIQPLVYAHCAECHRPGEVAPFSLLTYEDCQKRTEWIQTVVEDEVMPPWMASLGHGDFAGERQLTDWQERLITAWVEAGAPAGDPANQPREPVVQDGWQLGEPDVVMEIPYETHVPADGPDIFQHYCLTADIPEDKILIGFEFQAGNTAVVHHAVLFTDLMGVAEAKDMQTPEPGYQTFGSPGVPVSGVVGFWVPGMTPRFLPPRIGMPIPKAAKFLIQLHLHPSGKPETDRSKVGLYFADKKAEPEMLVSRVPLVLGTLMLDIPAGEPRHEVRSKIMIPAPLTLISVMPHMHLIGREMKVTAKLPSGQVQPLIWIKDWNFYWQDNYVYREPVTLPAGTEIEIFGVFDNSDTNALNPSHPPRRVFFGNDSDEEMFFAIFQTVAHGSAAEKAVSHALVNKFREEWARPDIRFDARPKIIAEAIEFLGGGDVILKMLLGEGNPGLQRGG